MDWVKIKIENNDKYYINLEGEVKNIQTGKLLKRWVGTWGYNYYILSINAKRVYGKRANLMAMTFLGHKPKKGLVIDHIDNDKSNDKLENLQIITHRENSTKERKPKSGYHNIYKTKKENKWRVEIWITNENKKKYGVFDDIETAIKVRDIWLEQIINNQEPTPKKELLNGTYINYIKIKEKYNLTSDQIKKWREGRGMAKIHPLKYIKNNRNYLYNENDIIKLIELKQTKKLYNQNLSKIKQNIQDWKEKKKSIKNWKNP